MSSMGMDKSGNQSISASTWTKLTTFTVRSGYPSTVITSSTLVMNANATGDIRFRGEFVTPGSQQFRVVKNGVTVLGSPATTGVTTTISAQSVVNGDTLELQAFSSGIFLNVAGGAAQTFLEFNQTTSEQSVDGAHTTTWGRTGAVTEDAVVSGAHTTTWVASGLVGLSTDTVGAHTTVWGRTGDIYRGQFYDVDGAHTTTWGISGSIIRIPKPANPPSIFTFDDVSVSLHTVGGRVIGDVPCDAVTAFTWGRERNQVSICDVTVATEAVSEVLEDLRPWVHWATFWHDDVPVWTGPLQRVQLRSQSSQIIARDPSTFMWRTRVPISRTWQSTTPPRIAELLWQLMFKLHRIQTTPFVLDGVGTESFTLTAQADQRMLHQFMDDLVKVGLDWTVVAGRPVLGKFPTDPVAELQECDFMVELERLRDGTQTFNDIRVQGMNYATTVTASLADLRLQNIVSIDDVFGVSNISKAAAQYVKDQAQIRDVLYIPGGATLHPEAPVTLDDLVPGKSFIVHAQGLSTVMQLDSMQVTGSSSAFDVQVTLVSDNPVSDFVATGGLE